MDEAIELLNKIKKPIAVLSISGPYRSGKSYFLSRFLGSQDAFQLGHTMNAKTFGIWMATAVLECDDHVILLLDTEGIDAATSKEESDASILVLTMLLSSHFIYNSLSVPRKQDLDKMRWDYIIRSTVYHCLLYSMFLQLASNISLRSDKENDLNELRCYFPDFLWLLRDVHLLPTDERGTQITPTDYLKSKVLVRSRGFFESQADTIARAIIAFFPSIECRTLPPPSTSPEVMRDITNKADELSLDFNAKVNELVEYLKSVVKVKKGFTGGVVNGPILAFLVKEYVCAINSPGAIPTISNAWEATTLLHQKEVMQELVLEYETDMNEEVSQAADGFPLEEENVEEEQLITLMDLHKKVLSQKITKLIQMTSVFANPVEVEALVKQLEDEIAKYDHKLVSCNGQEWRRNIVTGGVLYKFTTRNHQRSEEYCDALISRLYKPIHEKIHGCDADYTFHILLSDLANMQSSYFTDAKGPAKWDVYERKRKETEQDKEKFTLLKDYEADIYKAADEAEKVNQQNAKMAEQMNALRSQVLRESGMHKSALEEIQASHESAMLRMEKEQKERVRQEEEKYKEFEKAQMEDMMKIMQENQEDHEKEQKAMLEMMKQQMDTCHQAIEQMTLAVKNPPPEAPKRKYNIITTCSFTLL